MIKYSFVIPVKKINDYIRETVAKVLAISRDDFEIIIYPDQVTGETWPKTRQIGTGSVGPAKKRNLAINDVQGEFLIFIDDDAYPENNFLEILDKDFIDEKIVAVGGPAVTPMDDSFWQKVSGAVFLSSLSGGFPERYVPVGKKKKIDDWPSVNFSVRNRAFTAVGGFKCDYWPGEDTKLCIDLAAQNGEIVYDPELIVYHHRREGIARHLLQIGRYGIHRGFFAKKFPETSLKFKYFLPSLFLLFAVGGTVASIFSPWLFKLYLLGWLVYLLALVKAFWDIRRYEKNILVILNSLYYIVLTHLFYGWRFIQGFVFTRELKSKLR